MKAASRVALAAGFLNCFDKLTMASAVLAIEPLAWVTWKVVAVPAGASFHETVKVTPFWLAVTEWA